MKFTLAVACNMVDRVRQTQTADWQVNKVNIVVKRSNRFPVPKV